MTHGAGSDVFVGRSAELEVLRGLVAGVAAGRGSAVWVEGEPGIGKSALVAAGLAGAAGLGCPVFWGAADELRARFPLGVMLDCLGVDSRSAEGERGVIAGLLRGEGMGGVMAAGLGPGGDAVAAAAEQVLVLVDRLCAVSPVVLVLDDVQWADEVSMSVWHRLAGGVGQVPLLVVGVSRPVPRSQGVVVAHRGVVQRGGVVVPVGPLPEAEVAGLVAGLVGRRPGPGLLGQASRAGGNPLYVRELVDALVREHRIQVSQGLAEVTAAADDAAGGEGERPMSLAAAIEGRLGFLSTRAVEVLRVAALLGARFSVRELILVAGLQARELAGFVGEAAAAGILVESGMDLVFRHGLIQQALADWTPAGLRAELHRGAARALADSGAAAERVAGQLLAVGAEGEASGWVADWLAAHAATLVHRAPHAAAELLARVVADVPAGDERREVLTDHLAGVLFLLARYDQAEPAARRLLTGTGDTERRGRMAWTLAYTLLRTGRVTESLTVTDQALRDAVVPDVWQARLRSLRAVVLVHDCRYGDADRADSRYREASAAAAEAVAHAERAGDRFAGGYALLVQSLIRGIDGDDAGALEVEERALTVIGDDPETTDLRLLLLNNRLGSASKLDREADAEARQLLALAERAGTARVSMIRMTVADYLFQAGRWDDALAELETLFGRGADVIDFAVFGGRGLAALIAAHRDDRDALAVHLGAAEELPDPAGYRHNSAVDLLPAKAVAAERGARPGEAVAFLSAAVARSEAGGSAEVWLADLVRCALAAGDRPAAEAAAARSEDQASRNGEPSLAATARRCRGLADADPVRLAAAVAYYRTVTRPLQLGQALEDLAAVRGAGGDIAGARTAVREAVGIYGRLGAQWDVLRATARVRPYGVRRGRPGTRRPASGWAALTPTETKIANLVGEGLSNPEIGTRLFLSRYTVQIHVSRIMAKLEVHSRVEVARAVARQPADSRAPAARSTASPPPAGCALHSGPRADRHQRCRIEDVVGWHRQRGPGNLGPRRPGAAPSRHPSRPRP